MRRVLPMLLTGVLGVALGIVLASGRVVGVPAAERSAEPAATIDVVSCDPAAGRDGWRPDDPAPADGGSLRRPTSRQDAIGAPPETARRVGASPRLSGTVRSRSERAVSAILDALSADPLEQPEPVDDSAAQANPDAIAGGHARVAFTAMLEGFASGLAQPDGSRDLPSPPPIQKETSR